jgi:hypothetical protein
MKNLLFIALVTFFANISQAKDIREIWLSMPDSVITYLNKNKRIEMVDYIDMKVRADVKNALEGTSVMDTLTHDFLQVTLNEACTLQMRTLPSEEGDTLFCLVKSFKGPQTESEISIFNQDWQKIKNVTPLSASLIAKPDTMSTTTFDDLQRLLDVSLIEAQLSIEKPTLTLTLSAINLSKKEKEKIRPLLSSRTLLWNGKEFQ